MRFVLFSVLPTLGSLNSVSYRTTVAAGAGWALYAGLLGYLGGKTFEDNAWQALLLALAIAGTVAITIEAARHVCTAKRGLP